MLDHERRRQNDERVEARVELASSCNPCFRLARHRRLLANAPRYRGRPTNGQVSSHFRELHTPVKCSCLTRKPETRLTHLLPGRFGVAFQRQIEALAMPALDEPLHRTRRRNLEAGAQLADPWMSSKNAGRAAQSDAPSRWLTSPLRSRRLRAGPVERSSAAVAVQPEPALSPVMRYQRAAPLLPRARSLRSTAENATGPCKFGASRSKGPTRTIMTADECG